MKEELAPLCVPVEIRRADAAGRRCFRLALGLGLDRIRLRSPLPEELCGPPLAIRLELPPPTLQTAALGAHASAELDLSAVAGEVVVDAGTDRERAAPLLLLLERLSPLEQTQIENYVTSRLLSSE
jgi:hypothetical protein